MWLRHSATSVVPTGSPGNFAYTDLLWKARHPETITTRDLDDNPIITEPGQRAFEIGAKDLVGSTILAIRGNLIFGWEGTFGVPDVAANAALYAGITRGPANTVQAGTLAAGTGFDPAGPAAQFEDWMWWGRWPLAGQPCTVGMGLPGSPSQEVWASVAPIYCKSKRKLEDWGDTLFLYWRGNGADPCDFIVVTVSILLKLP